MKQQRVIAISRALGAGGEEIGRIVAAKMGLRYADEEIIVKAAEKAGVSPQTVAKAESAPGLVSRILESLGKTPIMVDTVVMAPMAQETPAAYEPLIEQVVRETAAQGNVVIVGHGASIPLAGTSGLLRVLVTAPEEVRVKRLAQAQATDIGKARKVISHSDGQRRAYLRRFYDIDEERADRYDLVINTETMTFDDAARIIVSAAG
jgi:cytidylate kinase